MWSTFPLKDSHFFKIVELENFLKQKLITNSAILNKWEFFNGMIDKWRSPSDNSIISPKSGSNGISLVCGEGEHGP